ncbi:MAG: endonuclease III [Candidatus Omnitrophica bacterium]|nr:endonuclease III [Candidatus Omnitrophota bacterium]
MDKVIRILEKAYPQAGTSLQFNTPFQLLIATILSAQTTDDTVNRITPSFFQKYPYPHSLASASLEEIAQAIRSVNFYRTKAKNIKRLGEVLCSQFGGKVPETMADLVKLPGVARKTANVVLSQGLGKAEGIVVDTHVSRLSQRLGFTRKKDPVKIEQDLMRLVSKRKWITFPFLLISHGREVCKAVKPACARCCLVTLCPYPEKTL